jgi:hypothetical protein
MEIENFCSTFEALVHYIRNLNLFWLFLRKHFWKLILSFLIEMKII